MKYKIFLFLMVFILCSLAVSAKVSKVPPTIIVHKTTTENPFNLSANNTDDLPEGSINLYYTAARDQNTIYNITNFTADFNGTDTDSLDEGVLNLYYTFARALADLDGYFCLLTGCNMTGTIDMNTNNITEVDSIEVSDKITSPTSASYIKIKNSSVGIYI